eukprot:jgi/Botrbrau1/12741/Bobra.67_1s0100.1
MSAGITDNTSFLGKRKHSEPDLGGSDARPTGFADATSSHYLWDKLQQNINTRLSYLAKAEADVQRQKQLVAAERNEVARREAALAERQKHLLKLQSDLSTQEASARRAVEELEARLGASEASLPKRFRTAPPASNLTGPSGTSTGGAPATESHPESPTGASLHVSSRDPASSLHHTPNPASSRNLPPPVPPAPQETPSSRAPGPATLNGGPSPRCDSHGSPQPLRDGPQGARRETATRNGPGAALSQGLESAAGDTATGMDWEPGPSGVDGTETMRETAGHSLDDRRAVTGQAGGGGKADDVGDRPAGVNGWHPEDGRGKNRKRVGKVRGGGEVRAQDSNPQAHPPELSEDFIPLPSSPDRSGVEHNSGATKPGACPEAAVPAGPAQAPAQPHAEGSGLPETAKVRRGERWKSPRNRNSLAGPGHGRSGQEHNPVDWAPQAPVGNQEAVQTFGRGGVKRTTGRGRSNFLPRPGFSPPGNISSQVTEPAGRSHGSSSTGPEGPLRGKGGFGAPMPATGPRRVPLFGTGGTPRGTPKDQGPFVGKPAGKPATDTGDSGPLGRALNRLAQVVGNKVSGAGDKSGSGPNDGEKDAGKTEEKPKEECGKSGDRSRNQIAAESALQADAPELLRLLKEKGSHHVPMLLNPNKAEDPEGEKGELDGALAQLGRPTLSSSVLDRARSILARVCKGSGSTDSWKKSSGKAEEVGDSLRDVRYTDRQPAVSGGARRSGERAGPPPARHLGLVQ